MNSLKEKARMSQCPLCKGYGTLQSDSNTPETCWFCNGKGRLEMVRLEDAQQESDNLRWNLQRTIISLQKELKELKEEKKNG